MSASIEAGSPPAPSIFSACACARSKAQVSTQQMPSLSESLPSLSAIASSLPSSLRKRRSVTSKASAAAPPSASGQSAASMWVALTSCLPCAIRYFSSSRGFFCALRCGCEGTPPISSEKPPSARMRIGHGQGSTSADSAATPNCAIRPRAQSASMSSRSASASMRRKPATSQRNSDAVCSSRPRTRARASRSRAADASPRRECA